MTEVMPKAKAILSRKAPLWIFPPRNFGMMGRNFMVTDTFSRIKGSYLTNINQASNKLLLKKKAIAKMDGVIASSARGFSSVGRASDLHSEGQEFESPSLQAAVIAQLVRARH